MNQNMTIMSGALEDHVVLPVAGRGSIAGGATPSSGSTDSDPLARLRDGFSVNMDVRCSRWGLMARKDSAPNAHTAAP